MPFGDRARRLGVFWLVLSVLAGGAFFAARYESRERLAVGDTYWYMKQAQEFAGVNEQEAAAEAASQTCRDINRSLRDQNIAPSCKRYAVNTDERYVEIFSSRPGYPLVAAPFVKVLGPWRGLVLATLLLAMLAAALAYLAITMATGSPLAGFIGTLLFLALPSGWWLSRLLAEAGVAAGYLAVLIATMMVWRGRRAGGVTLLVAALVWLFAFRSASGMAGVGAVIGTALVVGFTVPRLRRGALLTGGVGVAAMAVWQVISMTLHLPSLNATIQDYASTHWTKPEVADPIGWLINRNVDFWPIQSKLVLASPFLLVMFVIAAVVLLRWDRIVALPWLLIGVTGIAMLLAHPVELEWDRMNMPAWMPVSLAFGYAIARVLTNPGRSTLSTLEEADPETAAEPKSDPKPSRPEPVASAS